MAQLLEIFNLFDKTGNGCISVKDLGTVIRGVGFTVTEGQVRKLARSLDKGDSLVDYASLQTALGSISQESITEREVKEALQWFRSHDGTVSAAELRRIVTSVGEKLGEDEIDELFRDFGIDRSSKINIDEFSQKILN
eukprot:gnl/Spiro4/23690_TR11715_c0_g1_i1.p1 gnl/Spiro4/23690_TR11715_c0_g1~~gnl/Spiro4/23690_TR11715_c0_g1_i1.p1  ORF type:complete len:150 (+),score=47.86 gnl/Spiro4/23690_TR11715_c0_g1_i1:39-452(+)